MTSKQDENSICGTRDGSLLLQEYHPKELIDNLQVEKTINKKNQFLSTMLWSK